jgi:propionate CoA-transferase
MNKIEQVTFSAEYAAETGQEVLYITERAVFKLTKDGIMLTEIAPGVDLEKDILAHMGFKPLIAKDVKLMDERIFKDEKMGLTI